MSFIASTAWDNGQFLTLACPCFQTSGYHRCPIKPARTPMKAALRILFRPLLNPLEKTEGKFVYKPSHRVILLVMSSLFIFLASLSWFLSPDGALEYLFPVLVFGGAGLIGVIVGTLGEDVAVARLWGSR